MLILANMWFQTLMRTFFFNIDKIVFNFISVIYDFLITIARTSVLSQADIIDMADRIYKLLAVFMVFKVTFSLIMYVVNPDDFSDKSKGVGKLGTNIVISLCLLILTPYIFNYAYQLQTIILEDNSLSALIFGDQQENSNEAPFETAGDKMAFITMTPFFTPNSAIEELHNCAQLIVNGKVNPECSGLNLDYTENGSPETLSALTKDDGKENTRFTPQTLKNYVAGMDLGNLGLMFRQDMAIATDAKNTEYIMDYKYVFSTVVGVVVVLLLITFCLDVALRSIKLAFLQLIAPIPIISLVDPKSGKDGMFKKWYEMCFKTYLSLFIRLLALYFMAYIVTRIDKMSDIIDGSYVSNVLVKIFIIIGALMFAKQFPKILEGLGIKLDGDGKFFLNPLKKFEEQAVGGKKITGAARGLAAGTMVGTAGMLTGAGAGRALSGAFGGMKAGIQGKKFGEIRKDQATKNAEMRRAIASGSTFFGRRAAQIGGYFGTPGRLGNIEHKKMETQNRIDDLTAGKKKIDNENAPTRRQIKEKSEVSSTLKAMQDRGVSKVKQGNGAQGKYYQEMLQDAAALDAQSQHEKDSIKAANLAKQAEAMRQKAETYANTTGRDAWINTNMSEDSELIKLRSTYDHQAETAGINNIFTNPDDYVEDGKVVLDENGNPLKQSFSDGIDGQGKQMTKDISIAQASIAKSEREIQVLDEEIKREQENLDRLNADEKREKSNVEAVHSTPGGPSRPSSIRPDESTVDRRSG